MKTACVRVVRLIYGNVAFSSTEFFLFLAQETQALLPEQVLHSSNRRVDSIKDAVRVWRNSRRIYAMAILCCTHKNEQNHRNAERGVLGSRNIFMSELAQLIVDTVSCHIDAFGGVSPRRMLLSFPPFSFFFPPQTYLLYLCYNKRY